MLSGETGTSIAQSKFIQSFAALKDVLSPPAAGALEQLAALWTQYNQMSIIKED